MGVAAAGRPEMSSCRERRHFLGERIGTSSTSLGLVARNVWMIQRMSSKKRMRGCWERWAEKTQETILIYGNFENACRSPCFTVNGLEFYSKVGKGFFPQYAYLRQPLSLYLPYFRYICCTLLPPDGWVTKLQGFSCQVKWIVFASKAICIKMKWWNDREYILLVTDLLLLGISNPWGLPIPWRKHQMSIEMASTQPVI